MKNFTLDLKTTIYFGKNQIENLGPALRSCGTSALILTGKSSAKKYGVFDEVITQLDAYSIPWVEHEGISPNPRLSQVLEGIHIARNEEIDVILAVGGGSVIDAAKAVAFGIYVDDVWECYRTDTGFERALPIGVVLTLSATGSEMNGNSVITNEKTREKLPVHSSLLKPVFSILDPSYTISVPGNQTANGIADIFSHILEQYFSPTMDFWVPDRMAEGLLRTIIHWGPVAFHQPDNYEARANIMWASTMALNGICSTGKITDWSSHALEHELSAYYDIPHGEGLAILHPYWLEYVLDSGTLDRFLMYGKNVWNVQDSPETIAHRSIDETRKFFTSLNLPSHLSQVNISDEYIEEMAENISKRSEPVGTFKTLRKEDILNIYTSAL
ncbi:MAG: iron-containing alcohol dehydrogenase [Theionarchaea archaeon]|nr:iron-containing alcohol dehydrogenase [Theionarchaea archaeon]